MKNSFHNLARVCVSVYMCVCVCVQALQHTPAMLSLVTTAAALQSLTVHTVPLTHTHTHTSQDEHSDHDTHTHTVLNCSLPLPHIHAGECFQLVVPRQADHKLTPHLARLSFLLRVSLCGSVCEFGPLGDVFCFGCVLCVHGLMSVCEFIQSVCHDV